MQDCVELKGMIIKAEPIGEFDRRIVMLTDSRGKISAFARGARKPGNRFMAATAPFVFGDFRLYEGRNSYSLNDVSVQNYFEDLRSDYEGACYGMYLLEVADYYTRENNDEKEMLKLLYQSLRAILHPGIDNRLIRAVYEIKATVINGEFAGLKGNATYRDATYRTIEHIVTSPVEKLYTFAVKADILKELEAIASDTCRNTMNYPFKSLELMEGL